MSIIATDVFTAAQAFLNDQGGQRFDAASLLQYLITASEDLQNDLQLNGIPVLNSGDTVIPVLAGATTLALPADFLEPIELLERVTGSGNVFEPMVRTEWDPEEAQINELVYWAWRGNAIHFLGGLVNNDVRVRYKAILGVIAGGASAITYGLAKNTLAFKTASYAAKYMGENPTRGSELSEDYERSLNKLIAAAVKNMQSLPVRRQPFRRPRSLGPV